MEQEFDAIIIGTGQSGPSLAERFSRAGKKVAIIEQARFGGSCVNYGCTPTKTLVANAKIAHSVRNAQTYGINVSGFEIDYKAVKARKDNISQTSSINLEKWLRSLPNCTVFQGHASFEGPHDVRVNGSLLRGEKIFIDVGARPLIPEISGLKNIPYLTNESLLEIDFIPSHLLILGGGYIGLEFAQIFRRFGSRVTIFQRASFVMPKEDQDVSQAIEDILRKEGINIYTNVRDFEILPGSSKGNIKIQYSDNGAKKQVIGSDLLIAAGRIPNTDLLGLEKANVKVDKHGFIVVDEKLRTSQPHIWALGDCNGKGAFTHTSYNDFEIVAANLFDDGSRKVTDRILIYALFTDPPLGRVGMTEKEASQLPMEIQVAKMPMTEVARAREKGETDGFLKIIVDAHSKQILGASFLGTEGDEVIQMIAALMYAKAPYTVIERTVFIHPTVSELIPKLLSKLAPIASGSFV